MTRDAASRRAGASNDRSQRSDRGSDRRSGGNPRLSGRPRGPGVSRDSARYQVGRDAGPRQGPQRARKPPQGDPDHQRTEQSNGPSREDRERRERSRGSNVGHASRSGSKSEGSGTTGTRFDAPGRSQGDRSPTRSACSCVPAHLGKRGPKRCTGHVVRRSRRFGRDAWEPRVGTPSGGRRQEREREEVWLEDDPDPRRTSSRRPRVVEEIALPEEIVSELTIAVGSERARGLAEKMGMLLVPIAATATSRRFGSPGRWWVVHQDRRRRSSCTA